MLQTIRDKAQGIFAWIILILIIIPFALWGIQNYFDTGKEKPIAVVGDHEFFENDLLRLYDQQFARFLEQGRSEKELKQMALDRLIDDEVLLQAAMDKNMAVSQGQVAQFIRSLPFFQTNGHFDEKKYHSLLSAQHMSSAQFVAQIQRTLLLEQLRRGITDTSFATDAEVDRYYKLLKQARKIAYFILPLNTQASQVSEDEILNYYDSHPDRFQTPEKVSVEYLKISIDQIAKTIEPSEEALRQYYQEQQQAFTTPEQRHLRHILIAVPAGASEQQKQEALEKAKEIRQKLLDGGDFAKLAKEYSEDPGSRSKGGDLGLVRRGMMEKNFEQAAFSLPKGEISEPLETPFGYHLIEVTGIQPSRVKPFDEVRGQVLEAVRRQEAENRFYQLGERLAQLAYENPQSLEPAAEALGLKIQQSGLFTRTQGKGIAANPKARDSAFSEDVLAGNNSEPIELDDGSVVVVRVKEHQPSKLRPLKEAHEEIATLLRRQKARKQLESQATALLAELKRGRTIDDVAKEIKAKVKTMEVTRTTPELPEVVSKVFKAGRSEKGKPLNLMVALPDGNQAVVQILEVKDGDPSEMKPEEREAMKNNIARLYGLLTFKEYQAQLREKAKVKVNWPPSQ